MQTKHILITGASSGIGKELARQLAKKGHRLSLVARRESTLRDVQEELGGGESLLILKADVTHFDEMKAAVEKAEEALGPIDIVIANAGVAHHVRSANMDSNLVKEMIDTNFLGVVHTVGAVVPYFVARKKGHIVGISSLSAYFASRRYSVYGASKAGMTAYLNALRLDMEPKGIRVTIISPGFIKTPMIENNAFKMPFVLEVDEAVRKIIDGMEREVEYSNFPQPVYRFIQVLNLLPNAFYKRVMKKWPI